MVLTREFKDTIYNRAQSDPAYAEALLMEGVQLLLDGDLETAKSILRDYINATIGFDNLSEAVEIPAKSLMRMFSENGNPNARNLFSILVVLQNDAQLRLEVGSSEFG